MRIGVLGAGAMADVLSTAWLRAGHEVLIGARRPEQASELAGRISARAGSLREAAGFGGTVLLAVRSEGALATLRLAGAEEGTLAGRVLVDCSNPVDVTTLMLTTGMLSLAEEIARVAPDARVVKAFNQCEAAVWAMEPPRFDGRPLSVPLCGDDPAARAVTAGLVRDLGCLPLDIGPLHRARHLEAMAVVVIGLLLGGADPHTVFNLVDTAPPPPV